MLHTLCPHGHSLSSRVAYFGRDEALDFIDLSEGATAELLNLLEHGPVALNWFPVLSARVTMLLIILGDINHFFKLYFDCNLLLLNVSYYFGFKDSMEKEVDNVKTFCNI
jgi:hypothetical protein